MTLATSPRRVYPYYKYPCISNYSSLSVPSCLHLFRVSHTGPFSARQTSRTFYSQVTEFARNTITKRGWIEYTTRCDFFGANERVKPPIMPQISSRNIYTQLRYRSCTLTSALCIIYLPQMTQATVQIVNQEERGRFEKNTTLITAKKARTGTQKQKKDKNNDHISRLPVLL